MRVTAATAGVPAGSAAHSGGAARGRGALDRESPWIGGRWRRCDRTNGMSITPMSCPSGWIRLHCVCRLPSREAPPFPSLGHRRHAPRRSGAALARPKRKHYLRIAVPNLIAISNRARCDFSSCDARLGNLRHAALLRLRGDFAAGSFAPRRHAVGDAKRDGRWTCTDAPRWSIPPMCP